ncbi:MAG: ATP-NAD kinase family protein [Anaerolineae bacterium]|nr:ATP-NAD kinase family protein [Anaerolineae bacterium]
MGGSVGLKGTDGEMAARAKALGAEPVTPDRTRAFLSHMAHLDGIGWLAAPQRMGAAYLDGAGCQVTVVGRIAGEGEDGPSALADPGTTAADTRRIALEMVSIGADLLVFVGGDGTARDILDAVGTQVPVVGVPAGVKVYSGAFALSPRAAAEMVDAFIAGADVTEAEVLDIDEAAFRDDRLQADHYGYLLVPNVQALRQPGKEGSSMTLDAQENKREIATSFVERMGDDILYLLGPGTTVEALARELDLPKTLLGIDAVYNDAIVGEDLNEKAILDLLTRYPRCKIVVTPLGGNGFIFGRGNKPFTPRVLRQVGRDNIIVVATEHKLQQIGVLRVDTGDEDVDAMLAGYIEVQIGYDLARVVRVNKT